MTRDEITRFAIQCHLVTTGNRDGVYMDALMEFANLVAAKEREECAILCDNRSSFYWNWQAGNLQKHEENRHYAKASEECADAIRARGEQA